MKADSEVTSVGCSEDRSLTVCIRPYDLDFWEYEGSRAELESEGVIPAGTVWPDGAEGVSWDSGPLHYGLRRTRPAGMKGPRKLWLAGDWWVLRCEPRQNSAQDRAARQILQKRRELAAQIYRSTPEGRSAWDGYWSRVVASKMDAKFQAFKLLIPGWITPKRGRKPRAAQ